jgi:hypothetical protein
MRHAAVALAPRTWSFEPSGRLVHLRWAVAEIDINIETPSAGLDAAERALRIFAQRAIALFEAFESDEQGMADACFAAKLSVAEVRASFGQAPQLRAERARALHDVRRKLHRSLILVAEAMARDGSRRRSSFTGLQEPELDSMLTLRHMLSAFRGGLISSGEKRARVSWALEVAAAELSVLLANPTVHDLSAEHQQAIRSLTLRIKKWSQKEPDFVLGRALYREATTVPTMADDVSAHPLVLEHDEQALSELSALLANEPSGELLESSVLGHLDSLRGLDPELDRLELNLAYGAAGVLGTMSLRVADLRARLSRPPRAAAIWS